jgi:carbonic anhydrase
MPDKAYAALIEGYRRFRAGRYPEQARLYSQLEAGQAPRIMVISCADSRCDPSDIFAAGPGEMFVVRNVAGLVPPYDPRGGVHGVSAAVEFAVERLGVATIVVMGHGGCGGVKASLAETKQAPVGGTFLGPWVDLLAPARRRARTSLGEHAHPDTLQRAMEMEVVNESLIHLTSFPFVALAVAEGRLRLHGAWFSIGEGQLYWRDPALGAFAPVDA